MAGSALRNLQSLVAWVPLVLAVLAGAIGYGTLQTKAGENTRRIESVEAKQDAIVDLKIRGVRIEEQTKRIQQDIVDAKKEQERARADRQRAAEERAKINRLLETLEVRTRGLRTRRTP